MSNELSKAYCIYSSVKKACSMEHTFNTLYTIGFAIKIGIIRMGYSIVYLKVSHA